MILSYCIFFIPWLVYHYSHNIAIYYGQMNPCFQVVYQCCDSCHVADNVPPEGDISNNHLFFIGFL